MPGLAQGSLASLWLCYRPGRLRREAGKVVIYGLVAIAGGQLFYFNAIESIPIGLAVLLEYLGVVLVVGWLWVVCGQRPGRLTVAGVVTAIAGLALLVDLAGSAQLSPAGIVWSLGEAVSLAVYFLLSAATGEAVLPPLVMAWGGLCTGTVFLAVAGGTGAVKAPCESVHKAFPRKRPRATTAGQELTAALS